ncbi:MAG: hypothetical protein KF901_33465, partial [Myxococcales bacterium]|nr:hypothetical protein [Myxococcales bacterium]
MSFLRVTVALALVGCGSRTGLVAPPPPPDAGVDAPGDPDTFPCRWAYGGPTTLATSPRRPAGVRIAVEELTGAALVGADVDGARRLYSSEGADVLTLPSPASLVGGRALFLHLGADCAATSISLSGETSPVTLFPRARECLAGRGDRARFPIAIASAGRNELATVSRDLSSVARLGDVTVTPGELLDLALHVDDVYLLSRGGEVLFRAPTGDTRELAAPPAVAIAPDPLNGGVVALTGSEPPTLWVGRRGDARELVAIPPSFPAVETNETEALMLGRDGRIFVALLTGAPLRELEPLPEVAMGARLLDGRVGLVDGGSAGGVAYLVALPSGAEELRWRRLTCNR